jgi:hypothetical protein
MGLACVGEATASDNGTVTGKFEREGEGMGPPTHISFAAKLAAPRAHLWDLILATEVLHLVAFG